MKKKFISVLTLMMVFLSTSILSGCLENKKLELVYRHQTITDAETDSWLQLDPSDEDVEITWFIDSDTKYVFTDLVYKRTGVKIKFVNAGTLDSQELNNMISGDRLPDVITLSNVSTMIQLAEEGYCYPIDWLAEGYAPSLLAKERRYTQEHRDYYKVSDGHSYVIAQDFYNDGDIQEYEEMGGHQLSTYDCMVREDYLHAYIDYMTKQDPSFNPDTTITKPSGFYEMCKWVKNTYNLSDTNPSVLLSEFYQNSKGEVYSYSLNALMEFFGVPKEDSQGNLVNQYTTPEYVEVITFLNKLFNNHLISSANFSYDSARCGEQVLNGKPIALIGANHTLLPYLAKYEKEGYDKQTGKVSSDHRYVSIVLTNENGDCPVMQDFAGRGLNMTMITKNAEREDRIIKVFDYLRSAQGLRELMYGTEEDGFYTVSQEAGLDSTYGVVELTDKAKTLLGSGVSIRDNGMLRQSPLYNNIYTRMTLQDPNKIAYADFSTLDSFILYRQKSAYYDYTYSQSLIKYPLDISDRYALNDYIIQNAEIDRIWIEALPQMMMAKSNEAMMSIYNKAIKDSNDAGFEEWLAYRNKSFKKQKEYLGITYAWPKADPNYVGKTVTLYGSSQKYDIGDFPAWVYGE